MNKTVMLTDIDGDKLDVTGPYPLWDSAVLTLHAPQSHAFLRYDRAGAVELIEALTAAVEAHDAREAAEAERKAREACRAQREAAKLKRGDVVTLAINSDTLYTVVTDENAEGQVDVVTVKGYGTPGHLTTGQNARQFKRLSA